MTMTGSRSKSRKWLWIGLILLCGLTLVAGLLTVRTCAAKTADCAPAAAKGRVGGSDGAGMLTMSDEDLARELSAARDAGMWSIRVDFDWSRIEPVPGQRDWSTTDRVVEAVLRFGMCPLGLVGYAPPWAVSPALRAPDGHARPADPAQFAEFAAAAARRYLDSVSVWEVWNEPNTESFFKPVPDAGAYGQLLALTYPAIKAVDNDLWVLSGGLAPAHDHGDDIAPLTFLSALYANGQNRYFDAVAMHPYSYPELPDAPDTVEWNAAQQMWKLRDVMIAGGDSAKSIWITECGAPTGTSDVAVSEAEQAQTLRIVLQAAREVPWIGPTFVYSIRDAGEDLSDPEQNFGILQYDFAPKQAYRVVAEFGTSARRAPRRRSFAKRTQWA
ncbi:hypothetical protein A5740_17280 [Mycobacterium sp. GA-1841]|nr:hypothetical protein A5740_17280 [Mycobacterium sp. GA-1841]